MDNLQLLVEWNGPRALAASREFAERYRAHFGKPLSSHGKHVVIHHELYVLNKVDIDFRLQKATDAWQLHRRVWSSPASLVHKTRLFRAAVIPMLLPGMENTILNAEQMGRLETFQSKICAFCCKVLDVVGLVLRFDCN
eukprot:TRINITY_DN52326_c0_g1_i1.p1 TRINITY_DN52326_c0_g1~~TRINITY_DN52326_c0_g1_i1.p1  ORF type:complete len:139 (+),score=19.17 TRINITY_DN52326_c0_g1_i1:128-544(+)